MKAEQKKLPNFKNRKKTDSKKLKRTSRIYVNYSKRSKTYVIKSLKRRRKRVGMKSTQRING